MVSSYYEEFLNQLAQQMQQDPSGLDDPYLQRLMQARFQQQHMQQRLRGRPLAPGEGSEFSGMDVAQGLGRIIGGGASLGITGSANPLDALRIPGMQLGMQQKLGRNALSANVVRGWALNQGQETAARRAVPHVMPENTRALHGAEVREQLLAKRAAKGPRKPGGGRRAKTNYPPENNNDLVEMLAKSIPPSPAAVYKPKGGGLQALLGRVGLRRGGR